MRSFLFVIAAATTVVLGSEAPVMAGPAPLSTFTLVAAAPGGQVNYDFSGAPAHPLAVGQINESYCEMNTGPQGYALSSAAWPGPFAANAGDLLTVAGPVPLPDSVREALNSPVRAEARTGTGAPVVRNDSYPGVEMQAAANATRVAADTATSAPEAIATVTLGHTETHASSELGGDRATVHSVSRNTGIDIAGVLRIDAVVSTATTTTDGLVAHSFGATTVTGVTVAGQTASIDDSGVHAGAVDAPLDSLHQAAVEQALRQAGISVYMAQPVSQTSGAQATYMAGTLVIVVQPPNDPLGGTTTMSFGGVSAASVAARGGLLLPVRTLSGNAGIPPTQPGGVTPTESPAGVGSPNSPPVLAEGGYAGRGSTSATLTGVSLVLPGSPSLVWLLLAVLFAVAVSIRLRALPTTLLARAPAATCPNGDQS